MSLLTKAQTMQLGSLIIFSGLPGSGKSTLASLLAQEIKATYLRIDTIEQGLREVCDITQIEGKGYRLSYRIAQENLRLGNSVIADCVNPWNLTKSEWADVAKSIGANHVHVEVTCSDPEEHRQRVETRKSSVPGLILPTWQQIPKIAYQEWEAQRVIVDTAGKTEERCLEKILSHLKNYT